MSDDTVVDGDPRQQPAVPPAVDVVKVDAVTQMVTVVAHQVMPYEVDDFIARHHDDGGDYRQATAGRYKDGDAFGG